MEIKDTIQYKALKSSELFLIDCIEKSDCKKCEKMYKQLKSMEDK